MCGTCCIAYSISSLDKASGVECRHLRGKICDDYNNRPEVCRDFKADELCYFISDLEQDERVSIIRNIFGE